MGRNILAGLGLSCLLIAMPAIAAESQSYPTKSIRFIVPFPAGGIADVMARVFGTEVHRRVEPARRRR